MTTWWNVTNLKTGDVLRTLKSEKEFKAYGLAELSERATLLADLPDNDPMAVVACRVTKETGMEWIDLSSL